VVLFVSKFVLDMLNGLDCNRCDLLSPIYHAVTLHIHNHCSLSVFYGVAIRGRVFVHKICGLIHSERRVFEVLDIM